MKRNPELTKTLMLAPTSRTAEANTEPPRPPNAPSLSHPSPTRLQLYLIHRHAKRGEIEDVAPNCYCRRKDRSVLELVRFAALDSDDEEVKGPNTHC